MTLSPRLGRPFALLAALLLGPGCAHAPEGHYDFGPRGTALHEGRQGAGGAIRGWVYDLETGEPIDGVVLRICLADDIADESRGCGTLDLPTVRADSGMFAFEGLPPGTFRLESDPVRDAGKTYNSMHWEIAVGNEPLDTRLPLLESRLRLL